MQTCTRSDTRPALALTLTLLLALSALPMVVVADDAADRRAIESAAQQWVKAFNARDAAALAALTTEDVVVLEGGRSPVDGPARANQAWLRAAAITPGGIKSDGKEIVVSDDVAWRVGAVAYKRAGGEWHRGQSLEIWKRTSGGWKLHRQMSSHIIDQSLRPAPSEPVLDAPTN